MCYTGRFIIIVYDVEGRVLRQQEAVTREVVTWHVWPEEGVSYLGVSYLARVVRQGREVPAGRAHMDDNRWNAVLSVLVGRA